MSEADRIVTYFVMVIAREAGDINKKTEIRACSGISVLFVVGATHRNDHDIKKNRICGLQVFFGACIKESDLAFRKTRGHNETEMSLRITHKKGPLLWRKPK